MPIKPTTKEEEYFARQEMERRRQTAQEQQDRMVAQERERLRELHWMCCPKCGMALIEVDFRGVKVDQCTACNGIWLDAGELETVAAVEKGGFLSGLGSFFKG